MTDSQKAPRWFLIVAAVLSVWNLMGVIAFFDQNMMTAEAIAELSEAEQALYADYPLWANIAFAFAVFGGLIGCVLLVLKKALAYPILIASLLGIVVQMTHSFFISNSMEVYGPGAMVMPIMVMLIGIYLVWQAKSAKDKGWIS